MESEGHAAPVRPRRARRQPAGAELLAEQEVGTAQRQRALQLDDEVGLAVAGDEGVPAGNIQLTSCAPIVAAWPLKVM